MTTFLQGLIHPHVSFPCMNSSSSSLLSSHRKLPTRLFFSLCITHTGTKRTATCCQLLWDTTFCSSVLLLVLMEASWPVVLSLTSLYLLHRRCMGTIKPLNSCVCRREQYFWGSKRHPAVKWHSTLMCDTWQASVWLDLVFFKSVRPPRSPKLTMWQNKTSFGSQTWALAILEDDGYIAQRAPCCCHLLSLLCSPDKSYVYIKRALWLLG